MAKVGEDLVTFCGKCKQRTTHVVFAMEGDRVKRVQCKVCLSYHNYHPDPEEREASKQATTAAVRRRQGAEDEVVRTVVDGEEPQSEAPVAKAPRAKKAAAPKEPGVRKSRSREPATPDYSELWNQAMNGKDPESMLDYRPDANYEEGGLVNHPNFGVGVITKVAPLPEKRMHVLFREGMKTLLCRYNRPG